MKTSATLVSPPHGKKKESYSYYSSLPKVKNEFYPNNNTPESDEEGSWEEISLVTPTEVIIGITSFFLSNPDIHVNKKNCLSHLETQSIFSDLVNNYIKTLPPDQHNHDKKIRYQAMLIPIIFRLFYEYLDKRAEDSIQEISHDYHLYDINKIAQKQQKDGQNKIRERKALIDLSESFYELFIGFVNDKMFAIETEKIRKERIDAIASGKHREPIVRDAYYSKTFDWLASIWSFEIPSDSIEKFLITSQDIFFTIFKNKIPKYRFKKFEKEAKKTFKVWFDDFIKMVKNK